jgi:DNA-directed RNA polymerase subunit delta
MFPNPTEAFMNSDHEIEVTEENPAAAEALESVSETTVDHVAAAEDEIVPLSDEDEEETEGDDEEDEDDEEDHAETSVKAEGDDSVEDEDDDESADDADEDVAA